MRRPQDAFLLLIWLILGIVPSALLFFWIERNCTLPWIPQELGWPWLIVDGTATHWIITDVLLLGIFGVVHSTLAIPTIRNRVFFAVHPKNHRAVYVIVTGLTCLLIMSHWQSTGTIVFYLFRDAVLNSLISFVIFWSFIFAIYRVAEKLDPLTFIGLTDLLRSPAEWKKAQEPLAPVEALITTGLYSRMRHPIYTFTLAAILLTPFLSLDRLIVFSVFLVYILVGYRLEERKLLQNFGQAYAEYRKKVPALLPKP